MKKKSRLNQKIEAVTLRTLVVGIDIAKEKQWARFVDCRGVECGKAMYFRNDRTGFEAILARIRQISKENSFAEVIVGMEPTGHYWKALANYLMKQEGIHVVLVNPYHTKKAKELDDNSQTKSDKKDALTIARLVKDGRYSEVYLPHDVYADLRVLTTARNSVNRQKNTLENTVLAVIDEYFPEFTKVFKHSFKGKAAMQVLKSCPFPKYILQLGTAGVLAEIKKAVKKSVGMKRAQLLVDTARVSAGVDYGIDSARCKLRLLLESLELANRQLAQIEAKMAAALQKTGMAEYLLSIKGVGVVSLAVCLGELGDPLRFDDPRQLSRLAGYNLVEDSSGKNKSGTCISKRGRKGLRRVLYQNGTDLCGVNPGLKTLSLPQDQGSKSAEENAGVGCHQQETADLDLYFGKEKAVLRSRQSVWRSPQKPAHGSVKSFYSAIISQVKAQGRENSSICPLRLHTSIIPPCAFIHIC